MRPGGPGLKAGGAQPPEPFPLGDWIRRLSDGNHGCRLAAHLAIHGWLVEVMEGASGEIIRRQIRQVLRRAGQEGTDAGTVAPFVNLPPEVLPDFRRLRKLPLTEVREFQ